MTGSIVRADNSGLGTLAREFYDAGVIDKVYVVSNGVYKNFPERFPNRVSKVDELLECDKLFFFETPHDPSILDKARARGIRTIVMPMHECLSDPPGIKPDVWVCPSSLEMDLAIEPKVRLNVPASKNIKWKGRKTAHTFVHNAGHGGIAFRNGTPELIEAMRYVRSDIKLIVRSQFHQYSTKDPRIEFRYENLLNHWDLWNEGDVFIFPEKFNGLSLPIQEAITAGMAVVCTDRRPFNEWLNGVFIKPKAVLKTRIAREVDMAVQDPREIAKAIDSIANKDISAMSLWGKKWAEENSWDKLLDKYKAL